jgi:hypothetical protein
MPSPAEITLEQRAEFFKALGHPARLLILNLVQIKPRHGEELAMILGLNPATISHHLALLSAAGLLTAHKEQYYQTYALAKGALQPSLAELVRPSQAGLGQGVAEDAYRQKVLHTFLQRGRLVRLPAQKKKQQIVLEQISKVFEPGQEYTEHAVNVLLLDFHEDVASLRRGLIEFGLLERSGGIYRLK